MFLLSWSGSGICCGFKTTEVPVPKFWESAITLMLFERIGDSYGLPVNLGDIF